MTKQHKEKLDELADQATHEFQYPYHKSAGMFFKEGAEAFEKILLEEAPEFDKEAAREAAIDSAFEEGIVNTDSRFQLYTKGFKHGRGTQFEQGKLIIAALKAENELLKSQKAYFKDMCFQVTPNKVYQDILDREPK